MSVATIDHNEKFYEDADNIYFKSGRYSQWYLDAPFTDCDGVTYNCNEQYMMAKKDVYNRIIAQIM
jgi:predicted NAD-dependent protein-ADP-ribosyltransferase YbiA (DUF1768 family)